MQISSSIENNRTFFQKKLRPDISFDVVDRNLMIGGRDAFKSTAGDEQH